MRPARVETRVSRAARWSRRLAGFAAILLAMSAASHRFGMLETRPFLVVLAIVAGLAVLALLSAVGGFVGIWRNGSRGTVSAIWGVLVGCVVLAPFAVAAVDYARYPALNDISTDLTDPPPYSIAARSRGPAMNALTPITPEDARVQTEAYPSLSGRRYEFPEKQVLQAVDGVIEDRGWSVLGRSEASSADHSVVIEAAAKTLLMGFVDDVAIRVVRNDRATFVDMRSASRYGSGDFGANARRISAFMADLDSRMEALTGS